MRNRIQILYHLPYTWHTCGTVGTISNLSSSWQFR